MKIVWSPLAMQRMTEIAEYIAQDNMDASLKWIETIFQSTEKLQDFPKTGRIVPEVEREDIREVIQGNYRVIDKVAEEIQILTIRHTRQILSEEEISS